MTLRPSYTGPGSEGVGEAGPEPGTDRAAVASRSGEMTTEEGLGVRRRGGGGILRERYVPPERLLVSGDESPGPVTRGSVGFAR